MTHEDSAPEDDSRTKWRTFAFFCPQWVWPSTFDLGIRIRRGFCTMHLTAKFHHPTSNRSEFIVLTNKQINAAEPENTHLTQLCYADW